MGLSESTRVRRASFVFLTKLSPWICRTIISRGYSDGVLEYGKTARWALRAASSDRTYIAVFNTHGAIHRAWAKLFEVFLSQSSSRAQALQESMMKMKVRDKEDPQKMLTRPDDLAYESS